MIYYPSTYSVQYFKELMGIAQFSHTIPLGGGARYVPVVVHYVTLRLKYAKINFRAGNTPPLLQHLQIVGFFLLCRGF